MAGDVVGSDPKGPQVEEVGTEQVREQCRPEESAGSVSVGQAPRTSQEPACWSWKLLMDICWQ